MRGAQIKRAGGKRKLKFSDGFGIAALLVEGQAEIVVGDIIVFRRDRQGVTEKGFAIFPKTKLATGQARAQEKQRCGDYSCPSLCQTGLTRLTSPTAQPLAHFPNQSL